MASSGWKFGIPGRRYFAFSRLRYRLLLLVVLAVLPVLALIVSTAWEQRRLAADNVREDALRLVRLASSNHERLIEGARPLLILLAQNADVQNQNGRLCSALAGDILRRFPPYANVGAITPSGDVFCSARPIPARLNIGGQDHFRRALSSRDFTVSGYLAGPISGGRPVLAVSYPAIDDGGRLRAVLFVNIDLGWVAQFFDKARLPAGTTLTISDRVGRVLAHHPESDQWVGRTLSDTPLGSVLTGATRNDGTAEVQGVEGATRIVAYTALTGPPAHERTWVTIGIPRAVALAEGERLLVRNLAWAGAAFVLALVAAVIFGNFVIIRRMNGVVRAAEQLSAGDLSARAQVQSNDEIGVMAETFNVMAERLGQMVEAEHRANEVLAERVGQLDLLNRLGDLLQVCLTLDEAHGVIGRLARQLFPGDSGVLYAYSASRNVIEAVVSWGPEPGAKDIVFAPERCWALRSGRSHVVGDTREGLLCAHLPDPAPSAYLCTPLVAQGEALGVLYLSSRSIGAAGGSDPATATKQRLAEAVAAQLALGLANVRLREILRNQSIRDPLTGLFNRRYMEETLERELRRARRGNRNMGILMLDLDRFKQLNDTAGHEAGDAFLRELGELLQRSLRREDIPCRHGGEEFVVVLPDASLEDARRRAEQIRDGIKNLRTPYKGGIVGPLSASIGVAAYPEHGSTGEALIRTADAALYRAKREGRDRVMVATLNEGSVSAPER